MNKSFIFIANWKMNFTHLQTIAWCEKYKSELEVLHHPFVLCPLITTIPFLKNIFNNSTIMLGAQDCSAYEKGAYTGQISAASLQEIGCKYSIIGHQERRALLCETDDIIAQKALQLLKSDIIPIFCIGGSPEDHEELIFLKKQLEPLTHLPWKTLTYKNLIIAYEPTSAIGSGTTPTVDHIERIIMFLKEYSKQFLPLCTVQVMYGGSVSPQNSPLLKSIKNLDGLLIGKASLDFQALKKIVL